MELHIDIDIIAVLTKVLKINIYIIFGAIFQNSYRK